MLMHGRFLIAYRSYHYAIHHSSSKLKWTFRRRSLYKTGSLLNFRHSYYAMLRTKGLHCSLMAMYTHAIIILVYPILFRHIPVFPRRLHDPDPRLDRRRLQGGRHPARDSDRDAGRRRQGGAEELRQGPGQRHRTVLPDLLPVKVRKERPPGRAGIKDKSWSIN